MKIGVISNLYPPYTAGGYEILCQQTLRTLEARGHEVLVLTSRYGLDPDIEHPAEPGIRRIFELESALEADEPADPKKRAAVSDANAQACRAQLEAFAPSIVFVWNQRKITLGPALAAQELKLPTVFYLCDDHLADYLPRPFGGGLGGMFSAMGDRLWRKACTVEALNIGRSLCISRTLRETLGRAGLPVSHAQVYYPGIALDHYPMKTEVGKVHHPARMLYLGPLRPNKRIEIILRALGILLENAHNQVSLTIAGNGDEAYRQSLQRVAADLGVADETLFMGRLDYSQIPPVYRDHDLFIYASAWDEPFGLTHLEAMASGCPIVSTDCGGPTEYLAHEENSLIVEKEDPRGMAQAIERLLQNAMLRRTLASNARRLIEAKFNAQKSFDQMEAYLKKSAKKERAPQAATR